MPDPSMTYQTTEYEHLAHGERLEVLVPEKYRSPCVVISFHHQHPQRSDWYVMEGRIEVPPEHLRFLRDVLIEVCDERGV